jgi:hypothetical protein
MLQDQRPGRRVSKLQWLDLISGEANRKRPLDDLNGNHQARVIVFRDENPLDSIQAPSPNPDAASDFNKWMRREREPIGKQGLYRFDLAIGNRGAGATGAHKLRHPVGPQNGHPGVECRGDSHEDVVREHRSVNQASPIAPLMLLGEQRKEHFDPFELEPLGDSLFIPWPGLNGEPGRVLTRCLEARRTCRFVCYCLRVAHSSARPGHIAW